jgi:hypothetical protein
VVAEARVMSYRNTTPSAPIVPAVLRRHNPVTKPLPDAVGRLWYEFAEAFSVGSLAAATEREDLVEIGAELQVASANLMAQVADRLGLSADFETGFAALAKGASVAWKWLAGTSKAVLRHANTNRAVLLGAGAIVAVSVVAHDWLTEDEQVKRKAIEAKRVIAVTALQKMKPKDVAAAFGRVVGSIDDTVDPSGGKTWLWVVGGLTMAAAAYFFGHKRGRRDA